jgi:two-component system response regulator
MTDEFEDIDLLLVEDNEHDAEMTMRALTKAHFLNRVHWVRDGVEALEFVRCTGAYEGRDPQQVLKLMLLDLKMPRLGGIEVLRELKTDPKTIGIPIVVMTSSNQDRDVTESYNLGVNGYVTKPVQVASFMEAVAQIGMYWLLTNQAPTR